MRKLLDVTFAGAGLLACLLLVVMVVVMFAAIVMRQFGVLLPGHEEIATFAMVGMAFLGLPYAYRTGAHVRIETLVARLPDPARIRMNIWCVAVAMAICVVFCYFALNLVRDSFAFGDISEGLLAIPRWIPQLPIPLGLALFAAALLDDLIVLVRGGKASFELPQQDGAMPAE